MDRNRPIGPAPEHNSAETKIAAVCETHHRYQTITNTIVVLVVVLLFAVSAYHPSHERETHEMLPSAYIQWNRERIVAASNISLLLYRLDECERDLEAKESENEAKDAKIAELTQKAIECHEHLENRVEELQEYRIPYSSKFSWHNIFVIFVINPSFTKIIGCRVHVVGGASRKCSRNFAAITKFLPRKLKLLLI